MVEGDSVTVHNLNLFKISLFFPFLSLFHARQ